MGDGNNSSNQQANPCNSSSSIQPELFLAINGCSQAANNQQSLQVQNPDRDRLHLCARNICTQNQDSENNFLDTHFNVVDANESCSAQQPMPGGSAEELWISILGEENSLMTRLNPRTYSERYPDGFEICFENQINGQSTSHQINLNLIDNGGGNPGPPNPDPNPPPGAVADCPGIPSVLQRARGFQFERNNNAGGNFADFWETWLGTFPYDAANLNATYLIRINQSEYISIPVTIPLDAPRGLRLISENNTSNSRGQITNFSTCRGAVTENEAIPNCHWVAGRSGISHVITVEDSGSACHLIPGQTYFFNIFNLDANLEDTCDDSSCIWLIQVNF